MPWIYRVIYIYSEKAHQFSNNWSTSGIPRKKIFGRSTYVQHRSDMAPELGQKEDKPLNN